MVRWLVIILIGGCAAWLLTIPLRVGTDLVGEAIELDRVAKERATAAGPERTQISLSPAPVPLPLTPIDPHAKRGRLAIPDARPQATSATPAVMLSPSGPPFMVGDSQDQVRRAMGGDASLRTWDQAGGEDWWYGRSIVHFRDREVIGWEEHDVPLRYAKP